MIGKKCLAVISAGALGWLLQACAPAPANTKPQLHIVAIKGMQFQPATLQVHTNDTVQFINHDMVAHNATEATSKLWASPVLASDASWKVVIKQSASYYCTIHPVMKGTIEVMDK